MKGAGSMNADIVRVAEVARNLEHLYRKLASNHVGEMTLHKRCADDHYTQAMDECLEEMGGELAVLKKAIGRLTRTVDCPKTKDNDIVMFARAAVEYE